MKISDIEKENREDINLSIFLSYEIEEFTIFKSQTKEIIKKYKSDEIVMFRKFLKLIDETKFKTHYYGINGTKVTDNKFKISNLINIESIVANRNITDTKLSQMEKPIENCHPNPFKLAG